MEDPEDPPDESPPDLFTLEFEMFASNASAIDELSDIGLDSNCTESNKTYLALSNYHGYLDPAFVLSINPFWMQFTPPSATAHYTLGVVHLFIMTIGLLGNALVMFMFIRCRSLRTAANTLIINLAISDFLMLAKAPFMIYNSFQQGPALGELGCRLYGFFGGLTGIASIATLTAISIDRYFVVVYPLDPLRSITRIRSRLMVVFVWLYSTFFSVVPALDIGFSKYVPEGFLTSCSFDYLDRTTAARIFMFVFFVFAYVIPFSIITFCYFHILREVSAAKKIQSNRDQTKRTEIKLAIIILAVIGLWFLAWTPYSVVALLGISGQQAHISPLGSMIPAVFCKSAACIDPYVYAMTHPRFQMEFRRMFVKRDDFARYQSSRCTSMMQSRRTGRDVVDSSSSSRKASFSRESSRSVRRPYPSSNRTTVLDDVLQEGRVISTISEEVSVNADC